MTRPALLAAALAGLAAATDADPPRPAPPAGTVQDVVYFARGGPVRARFHVGIAGKPADAAWQAAVDALFAYLDRNGDGVLDAKERAALTRPAGRQQQGLVDIDADGNPVAVGAGLQLFADKDAPADKAAFAAKLRAARLGPVEVTIQQSRADAQKLTDALFAHLDRDGDGKLSAAELAAAADRLAALDLDEDELITGAELLGTAIPARPTFPPPVRRAEERDEEEPSNDDLLPLPAGSAAAVKAVLARRDKDKSGSLSRAEFGADPKAFAALDKDGNGQLDSDEIAAWLRSPPDVEVVVAFGGNPAAGDGPVRTLGDARLRVTFDPGAASAAADAWKRTADRLRAEYDRLAKDKKAVEKKQLEDPTGRGGGLLAAFAFADRNDDKTLTREELDAALAAVAAVAACRVDVTIVDQGRGLFELIDTNGDGQLSLRELKASAGLAKELDRGGDGRLGPDEVPRLFPTVVAPASLPVVVMPPQRFVRQVPRAEPGRSPRTDVPGWFTKMDRNGDGDVSRREFLGPVELFRKLDRDGDGLISPDEARAAK